MDAASYNYHSHRACSCDKHLAPRNHIRLIRELAMAGHDLGLVVRHLDVGIGGPDQAPARPAPGT
jgi:hypothetical protein